MIAAFVNAVVILVGGAAGLLLRRGISERFKMIVMQALALAVFLIGLQSALKGEDAMVVIVCMVAGAVIGEALKLEQRLDAFGKRLEIKFDQGGTGTFGKGFVTATLVYCVGAMAVVGSLEAGLSGNYATIFAKSGLDGVSSVIFASTLGAGVLFSAIPVLLYQGAITLLAHVVGPFLSEACVAAMTSVGGLLIIGISLNMLEIKSLRVVNLLPAILLPPAVVPLLNVLYTWLK